MNFKIKFDAKTIIIIGLALVVLFSLLKCHSVAKEKDKRISELELLQQKTDSIKNLQGQTILEQEAIVTNSKKAIGELTDSIFNLKKKNDKQVKDVIAYYKSISKTTIKDRDVPYVDTVAQKKWADSVQRACAQVIDFYETHSISVPRTAADSNVNYSAKFTIGMTGVHINELSIPDSQYVRFVTMKGGLLKKDITGKRHFWLKSRVVVQVLHTNPLIAITGQNSAIYESPPHPRWLEKAILIGAGIYVGTKL